MKTKEVTRTRTLKDVVTYQVAPCIKCGEEEDIRLWNYEDYQGPPLRGGECNKCKAKFQEHGAGDEADAAKFWNQNNDPVLLIQYELKIQEESQKRVQEYLKIKEKRLNENKLVKPEKIETKKC